MKRKNHSPEQIVRMLQQADVTVAQGGTVEQTCRESLASASPLPGGYTTDNVGNPLIQCETGSDQFHAACSFLLNDTLIKKH